MNTGQYGKVIKSRIVYDIAFDAETTEAVDEEHIITPGKQVRTRKKKELIPPNVQKQLITDSHKDMF